MQAIVIFMARFDRHTLLVNPMVASVESKRVSTVYNLRSSCPTSNTASIKLPTDASFETSDGSSIPPAKSTTSPVTGSKKTPPVA